MRSTPYTRVVRLWKATLIVGRDDDANRLARTPRLRRRVARCHTDLLDPLLRMHGAVAVRLGEVRREESRVPALAPLHEELAVFAELHRQVVAEVGPEVAGRVRARLRRLV